MVYLMDGNTSVHHRLPLKQGIAAAFLLFGEGTRQPEAEFTATPSLIFNQISDVDTHVGALQRCVQLCAQINAPVINHPRYVMQTARDRVAGTLQNIDGVIMPRTFRFQPRSPQEVMKFASDKDIGFPYIVRVAGDHQGKSMVRLDHPDDFPAMHVLPLDGRDFYLTEYVDYRAEDGFYHKQRIVVVDGEPILRHSLYRDDWIVHANSRAFMLQRESWDDDKARYDRLSGEVLPQLRPAIDEITSRLKLEYFGIDCNLRPDGQMLIFEANANMNNLHGTNPEIRGRLELLQKKLQAMLSKYSGEQVI
jgi:hypothetical protein